MSTLTEFVRHAWLSIFVPSGTVIASLVVFFRAVRENRKLQLEIAKLQREAVERDRVIVAPTPDEIRLYTRQKRVGYFRSGAPVVALAALTSLFFYGIPKYKQVVAEERLMKIIDMQLSRNATALYILHLELRKVPTTDPQRQQELTAKIEELERKSSLLLQQMHEAAHRDVPAAVQ
jgi:hypothetical protein